MDLDPREFCPWAVKESYRQVFFVPSTPWSIWANWDDAYFESAKLIVDGVVNGRLPKGIHGVAGVFLFRHYVELEMKFIILHSRWLKDGETNALRDEIEDVMKTHSLRALWNLIQRECPGKLGQEAWDSFDTQFVERCVVEFEALDPKGERFRYHSDKFGVDKRPEREHIPVIEHLGIDFSALLFSMQHVRDVLDAIDTYLVETHGQNAEWESILNSF